MFLLKLLAPKVVAPQLLLPKAALSFVKALLIKVFTLLDDLCHNDPPPSNEINGTAGDDTLNGTEKDEVIRGQDGNDTVNAGAGKDTVEGGNGNDTLNGDDGTDTLNGGAGDDTLNGGNDNDVLNGGDGNDTLTGGSGADHLNGGDGNDIYILTSTDYDTISDTSGNDTLMMMDVFFDEVLPFMQAVDLFTGTGAAGSDGLVDSLRISLDGVNALTIQNFFNNTSSTVANSAAGSGAIENWFFNQDFATFEDIQALLA